MSSSGDESDETTEPPDNRRKITSLVAKRIENNILSQLKKQYSTTDQEGPEINAGPARVIYNLLKEKADNEKLNDIMKRSGKPKNSDALTETNIKYY